LKRRPTRRCRRGIPFVHYKNRRGKSAYFSRTADDCLAFAAFKRRVILSNLALAACPNFTLPGDISATARYFAEDITAPFVLDDGHLPVPDGPGTGVEILPDALARLTTMTELLR